jgi:endothelin-converting enzyme
VERLLFTLSEEEEKLQQTRWKARSGLLDNNDANNMWPDWPWPPWGDDEPDEKPNRTEIAHKLAKEVLEFETKLASASLDG